MSFKFSIPSNQKIASVFIDDETADFDINENDDIKTITFNSSVDTKKIRIETTNLNTNEKSHSNNLLSDIKIGIIKTKKNHIHVNYWEKFILDFIGMQPTIISEYIDLKQNKFDYSLIIMPNVKQIDDSLINWIENAIKNGTGLILTSAIPNKNFLSFEYSKKINKYTFRLIMTKNHTAIKPFKINNLIPFKQQLPIIKYKSGLILISAIDNYFLKLFREKIINEKIIVKLENFFSNLNRITILHSLIINQILIVLHKLIIKKKPIMVIDKFHSGKISYFAFDPVYQICIDSKFDKGKYHLSENNNFLQLVLSTIQWTSKLIVIKELYKNDKIPILYSIDTEASVNYYNYNKKKCLHCIDKKVMDDCSDLKMENCLINAANRLENYGAKGTFHIDTAGIYDEKDVEVIRNVSKNHDISVHQGGDGIHYHWKINILNADYIINNLEDCINKLRKITKKKIYGIRYPGWIRTPGTHDIIAKLNLKYDTSSVSHIPYATTPFRFFANDNNEALDLWEIPCIEIGSALNRRIKWPLSILINFLTVKKVINIVRQTYEHNGIIVLMDHDMTIGANPKHIHGNVQFNECAFNEIMSYCYDPSIFPNLWITTGYEFIKYYRNMRRLKIDTFKVFTEYNSSTYLIDISRC